MIAVMSPQKWTSEQMIAARQLLDSVGGSLNAVQSLMIFVDSCMEPLSTTLGKDENIGSTGHGDRTNGVAQVGPERHDAFGFYLGDEPF